MAYKLRQAGYRLIYRVDDSVVTVSVIAVGQAQQTGGIHHRRAAVIRSH
jgi:mRNA-degrading endonuclease RelE of RelBE toxin-antitoxin system